MLQKWEDAQEVQKKARSEVGAGVSLQDQSEPFQPQQWGQPAPSELCD